MGFNNHLARYKIRKKISAGGMASVFLAYDTVLGREVALKMVHPHLLKNPDTIKRFSNEAKAIASLSHEHIIKIFDFGEDRSRHFLVMEYIDGITLEDLIAQYKTLPNLVMAEISRQVLSGLLCVHDNNIFHRDIKPDNILIDRKGCIHLSDFGIAYLVNQESITHTGSFIGSPNYISPEQISGAVLRANTDIFSLGIVLYRCLTGVMPFRADTPQGAMHAILNCPVEFPRNIHTPSLLWFVDLVEACLIKDASIRPDAAQVAESLDAHCQADSLQLGKHRITGFLSDPLAVYSAEKEEIFACYRSKMLNEFKARHIATGLRYLEQARSFGNISSEDQQIVDTCLRWSSLRRFASILSVVLISVTLAIAIAAGLASRLPLNPTESKTVPIATKIEHPLQGATVATSEVGPEKKSISPGLSISPPGHFIDKSINHGGASASIKDSQPDLPPEEPSDMDDILETRPPLESSIGFFSLFTNPPWVTIYIDNIERGKTPALSVITLSAGSHSIKLSKAGFMDYLDSLSINPYDTMHLRIRLIPMQRDTAGQ
jgi:serine/threonine protein kinase